MGGSPAADRVTKTLSMKKMVPKSMSSPMFMVFQGRLFMLIGTCHKTMLICIHILVNYRLYSYMTIIRIKS